MTKPTDNKEAVHPEQMPDSPSELELLQNRCRTLGISFHHNNGVAALTELVNEKIKTIDTPTLDEATIMKRRYAFKRKEANKLIRCNIVCQDPTKRDWAGEVVSVSNRVVGTIKKFIPFSTPQGYHIPAMLLKILEARQYTSFSTIRNIKGVPVTKTELRPAFVITRLPALSTQELNVISDRQAANAGKIED